MSPPSSIRSINQLEIYEKRRIYSRLIPPELLVRFNISPYLVDKSGNDLFTLNCPPGTSDVEMELRHEHNFHDPILFGHIADTVNGQIHILLFVMNNPNATRYNIDYLDDGTSTKFGTVFRNIATEQKAMEAGLAPGQIRPGMRLLSKALTQFEHFVKSIGHDIYFIEPLFYHNAVIFEHYGFAYQMGKRRMELIQQGFEIDGELFSRLDSSTPFRSNKAANSIRLRSWAIHDNILGEPYTNVTMYKRVGKQACLNTYMDCPW